MNRNTFGLTIALALSTLATLAGAQSPPVAIAHSSVIPVIFNDQLSIRDNEPGDHFTATVTDDNNILPKRTLLDGHVVNVHYGNRYHPASMDLHFDDMVLPDGTRERIDALPVPLNAKFVRRGRDGRFYLDEEKLHSGTYVAAGTIGGLIVGGLFNRPFMGAFLGGLGGAIAGIAERNNPDNYLIAKRGTKVGVLFEQDAPLGNIPITDDRSAPPIRNRDYEVRLGDKSLRFPPDQSPYYSGSTLMVPLPFMADEMDLTVDQRAEGPIYLENENNMLHLEQGSDQYRLNGRKGTLAAAVENRNEVTYVPIEILASISARTVYVNGTKLSKNP